MSVTTMWSLVCTIWYPLPRIRGSQKNVIDTFAILFSELSLPYKCYLSSHYRVTDNCELEIRQYPFLITIAILASTR
jgi:hypothetical protein